MKKFIPILSLSVLVLACSSEPQTEARTLQSVQQNASIDTAGLAQFQQWKAQNELVAVSPNQEVEEEPMPAPVKEVTIIREVRVQQPAPVRKTVRKAPAPQQDYPEPVAEKPSETTGGGEGEIASTTGSGTVGETAPVGETAKEGGWSNAKKGTVIGGAGGAVIGAVIGKKNRAAGAVIGGVLGGAVGYGLGKKKDKNSANN